MKNSSSYSSGSMVGAVLAVVIVALTVGVAGCTASQGPRSPGPIGGSSGPVPTVAADPTPTSTTPSGEPTSSPGGVSDSAAAGWLSTELVREAVEYVYRVRPLSFADGDCFDPSSRTDFGSVAAVTIIDAAPPRVATLGFSSGPVSGTAYDLLLRIGFGSGRVSDYPTVIFHADSGGWLVNVNQCTWV